MRTRRHGALHGTFGVRINGMPPHAVPKHADTMRAGTHQQCVRLRAERLASIESMPAEAAPGVLLRQDLLRLTASATASAHSEPGTAVAPPCIAASADAHAVSPLEHGL